MRSRSCRRVAVLLALLVALFAAPSTGSVRPLDVRVVVRGLAPADVTIQAFVERDDRNRAVEFIIDSDRFYASSVKQLDRERAPRTNEATFRSLPAGTFEIRVNLWGTDGIRDRAVWRGAL